MTNDCFYFHRGHFLLIEVLGNVLAHVSFAHAYYEEFASVNNSLHLGWQSVPVLKAVGFVCATVNEMIFQPTHSTSDFAHWFPSNCLSPCPFFLVMLWQFFGFLHKSYLF